MGISTFFVFVFFFLLKNRALGEALHGGPNLHGYSLRSELGQKWRLEALESHSSGSSYWEH
jgi:hypothetical protein